MGYRNYIGKLPKKIYEEIKDLTEEQITEKYGDDFYFRNMPHFKELHCFGKYCDFPIDDTKDRFFTHKMSWESDMEFDIGSEEMLKTIIETFKAYIIEYHTKLYEVFKADKNELRKWKLQKITNVSEPRDPEKLTYSDVENYFRGKVSEWANFPPYNLDKNRIFIDTEKYEYDIFQLVSIYRQFDWENDVIVWYGS